MKTTRSKTARFIVYRVNPSQKPRACGRYEALQEARSSVVAQKHRADFAWFIEDSKTGREVAHYSRLKSPAAKGTTAQMKVAANIAGSTARAALMSRIFDALAPKMEYLAFRWADEYAYEDIEDYKTAILDTLDGLRIKGSKGLKITRMTARPFGFICTLMGGTYKVSCNARSMSYSRVG
jgi:hypothetical protein